MSKLYSWFVSVLALCLSQAGSAQVLFRTDFSSVPKEMTLARGISLVDKALFFEGSKGGVLTAKLDFAAEGDTLVRFQIRQGKKKEGARDGHIGATLHFADTSSTMFYSRGKEWIYIRKQPGRKKVHETLIKDANLALPQGATHLTVEIALRRDHYVFRCGRFVSPKMKWTGSPLAQFHAYTYNFDCEIRNLEIVALTEEKPFVPGEKRTLLDEPFESEHVLQSVKGARLADGVSGKGLSFVPGAKQRLRLELPKSIGKCGTILFWYRPEVPVAGTRGNNWMLTGKAAEGKKTLLNVYIDGAGFNSVLTREEGLSSQQVRRWIRGAIVEDDWHFYALTFDEGYVQNMLDALPYYYYGHSWRTTQYANLALAGITSVELCPGFTYDNLHITNYAMSEAELSRIYRRTMPVDLLIDDSIADAGVDYVFTFRVAPGGTFMAPPPVDSDIIKAKVRIEAKILDLEGRFLLGKTYELDVSREHECRLPAVNLAHGQVVRLVFDIETPGGRIRRTKIVKGWKTADPKPVGDDYNKGRLLFEKEFAAVDDPDLILRGPVQAVGGYLEAGPGKYDHVALIVPFAKENLRFGQPVLLEIDWPDDKPRNIGLYMYKPQKSKALRDCLAGGITAGNLYPNSGGMQTATYLFYPGFESYVFEARTMSSGYPAAIAALRIYAIDGGLPRLAINYPEGLPHRMFGHCDEDQTFDYLLDHTTWGNPFLGTRYEQITDVLLEYYDYTGQEAWDHPLLRYGWLFYPVLGSESGGQYPYKPDFVPYMFRAFGKRGKSVHAILNLHGGMPEFFRQPGRLQEWTEKGWIRLNAFGEPLSRQPTPPSNMLVPEVEAMFLGHLEKILLQNARYDGFEGVDYCMGPSAAVGAVRTEVPKDQADKYAERGTYSYDDFTVSLYRAEAAPQMPDFNGADRFMKRFEYLAKAENEATWLEWNIAKVAGHLKRMRALLDKHKPALKLVVSGGVKTHPSFAKIPGVSVDPMRKPTHFRWSLQHAEKITDIDEKLYDLNRPEDCLGAGTGVTQVSAFHSYGETFTDSPHPGYASYFQNIDLKPPGRHALKDPVFSIAKYDMLRWTFGGQPLAAMGREDEIREFARAYCALPALPFQDVPGATDPVTVRYLDTKNGCYVYCANLLHADCSVAIDGAELLEDLSDGAQIQAGTVALEPYQLRSFLVTKGGRAIASAKASVPEGVVTFYRDEVARTVSAVSTAKELGLDASAVGEAVAKVQAAIGSGLFAEAHRLLFSAAWHKLKQNLDDKENVLKTADMLRQGRVRVNCGSVASVELADGRLFLRDTAFADGLGYGYYGRRAKACIRENGKVRDIPEKPLFASEVYDIDGYKFRLADGTYRVTLYLRWGYEPSFRKKLNLASAVHVGNESREVVFIRDMKGDFSNHIVLDSPQVEVKGGILDIRLTAPEIDDCRLLNGIEIEPIR